MEGPVSRVPRTGVSTVAGAVHYFGIRHHGPGCARSLLKAFEALRPDCVLVEGPSGAEPLLGFLADAGLQPPVALLSHCPEQPDHAVFHPFAEFSPEWQALRWAVQAGVEARFIDVPAGASLAWSRPRHADAVAPEGGEEAVAVPGESSLDDADSEALVSHGPGIESGRTAPATDQDRAAGTERADSAEDDPAVAGDPLDWLARAAGYGDGESWWNHMVEERGDGEELFEAIAEAMCELRERSGLRSALDPEREALREAHMRQAVREAVKAGHARIAVVCGAWHVPALKAPVTAVADKALLKGLAKGKAQTTWVPWTYRHLSLASGYGAGIAAPGWYHHLWSRRGDRTIGWFARVARLLREHELDCSSAHLIEATRLAEALAALRERPQPGLDELGEATRSVLCNGDDAPMRLIAGALLVGDTLGSVPPQVPTVPLQRDLEAQQKRLRLKPEALSRTLDLDLRNDTDLQRSHLLHRLAILGIPWGTLSRSGRSGKGTFHEVWELAWDPHHAVELIVASRYGHTLEQAATARAVEAALATPSLAGLADAIDRVLLADLPGAVTAVVAELEARSARTDDALALLAALPALGNVYRYGNVRRTDAGLVGHVFDSMVLRAAIGLPLAVAGLDHEAASAARETVLGADRAVALRQGEEQTVAWRRSLRLIASGDSGAPLLRGVATRLLLDASVFDGEHTATLLSLNLSAAADPQAAAHWLEGFLNRNASVLLHGDVVWPLLDRWLAALADEHFMRVLPLVRRTFAEFEAADRRDLAVRVRRPGAAVQAQAAAPAWDEARVRRALPALRELLGVADVH